VCTARLCTAHCTKKMGARTESARQSQLSGNTAPQKVMIRILSFA
jgi:hypothetical protein